MFQLADVQGPIQPVRAPFIVVSVDKRFILQALRYGSVAIDTIFVGMAVYTVGVNSIELIYPLVFST